jgi:hypothetical protein
MAITPSRARCPFPWRRNSAAILDRPLPTREERGEPSLGGREPIRELLLEVQLALLGERRLRASVAEGLGMALVTALAAL